MASTSNRADLAMRESSNTSSSTSGISSSQSSCASCFEWVSSFVPWRSFQSDSNPDYIRENEAMGAFQEIGPSSSTSTTDRIPENENMAAFARILPAASTFNTELIPKRKDRSPFDSLALSASSSASKLMKGPSYQVFINQQGVKSTVATALYGMLTERQLSVFLGGTELEYGDFLPGTLEKVMTSALIHIAIFSERYAESPWCLAELSFMLKTGTTIFPVFYYVDPSDLRLVNQGKGLYAHAFKEHQQKGRYSLERLNEWKDALYQISFYEGEVIRTIDDETRLLNTILNRVLKAINTVPLVVAKYPVGLEEIVRDFERYAFQSSHCEQNVQIIGIWGMGGSGKTTLAKMLYNKRSSSMERSSFVFNIRDAANKRLLHKKQKGLLDDLGMRGEEFDNVESGTSFLSIGLRYVKVLIILDDVDSVEQLDVLLPTIAYLERGSLIIVTTRAYDVLKSWNITSIYKMKPLSKMQAEQLFCRHTFLKSYPPNGFKDLVEKFLKKCNGLPFSLKIFGAKLYGNFNTEYWELQLRKFSERLPDSIFESLKISYERLDEEEKEIFLDAACFLIKEEASLAMEIWEGLGCSALSSWVKLEQNCLVEFDLDNRITMHDHIRDMGRHIANSCSPYRFWIRQPTINLDNQEQKIISIQGIMATSTQKQWINHMKGEGKPITIITEKTGSNGEDDEFPVHYSDGKLMVHTNGGIWTVAPSLVGLHFFVIRGDYYNDVMREVSRTLVWLRWFGVGQRNIPSPLSWKELRVLELHEEDAGEHHLETLWSETDSNVPLQLRELVICQCYKLQGVPHSIERLNHLKKIVIIKAYELPRLPDEFCLLQSLEYLVLYDCAILSALPSNFGNLVNLRHLCLSGCGELRKLPVSFKNLTLLEYLNLRQCYELRFTSEDLNILEKMTKLEILNLVGCEKLEELPRHITNQACLKELYLRGTSLRELPVNIGLLSKLKEMSIGGVLLTSLPVSLGNLSFLTNLSIRGCSRLKCLPEFMGDLNLLKELEIHNSGVKSLPKSVKQLKSLQRLIIFSCPISELDFGAAPLPSQLGDLKCIHLRRTEVCRISNLENCCPNVETLTLEYNHHLKEIETLPKALKSFRLVECKMLKVIPSFVQTTLLREFEIRGCQQIQKIEGLQYCTRLESLMIDTCWEVSDVRSLEHMEQLRKLQLGANKGQVIERCIQTIKKWPDGIEICIRAVSVASSLVDKFLSTKFVVVDSVSKQRIQSKIKLVHKRSSDCDAIMLCFILNCASSQMILSIDGRDMRDEFPSVVTKVEEGRWAWIGVFTQRYEGSLFMSQELSICGYGGNCEAEDYLERGLVVRGEEQKLAHALYSLLGYLKV